jgi:photosystem II stability/assembly factor-like uncharacterized protein
MATLRRAGPVLALAALLAAACGGPADSVGHGSHGGLLGTGHARPASLLTAGHGTAAEVPASFQPAAASFLSAAAGFVLGGVGCRMQRACAARLVATADGGARWHFLRAPAVRFFNDAGASRGQASRVSSVVFASRRDGWLYGPGLWSTRDGGARWRRLSLGGGIDAMAASAGTAYAVVSPRGGGREELYRSPTGQDGWVRAGPMTARSAVLAVSGRAAWFGTSTHLWATADGAEWHRYSFGCPGASYYGLSGIAAASRTRVVFLCTGNGAAGSLSKEVLTSSDGGKRVQLAGHAPLGGGTDGIAVPPHHARVITLAAVSGASFLDRSADGGKTWTEVTYPGGAPWNSLSYLSRTTGWIVLGRPGLGSVNQLWRTSDAGRTWNPVAFRAAG